MNLRLPRFLALSLATLTVAIGSAWAAPRRADAQESRPPAAAETQIDAAARGVLDLAEARLDRVEVLRLGQVIGFARRAHRGQVRDGGEPAMLHALRVTRSLLEARATQPVPFEAIAAAVLHDVVEDTDTRLESIRRAFGSRIAGHVADVTLDPIEQFDGDKEARNRAYYERFARSPRGSHLIKLHDRLDNIRDMRGWSIAGRLGYLASTRRWVVAAIGAHQPDLAARLEAEVAGIETRIEAEWRAAAKLTIPELVAKARAASGERSVPFERGALLAIVSGFEMTEVERRLGVARASVEAARAGATPVARPRAGFIEQLREQVRRTRGRAARRGRR